MLLDNFKNQIKDILKKYPISKAAIFGSFARGEETIGEGIGTNYSTENRYCGIFSDKTIYQKKYIE